MFQASALYPIGCGPIGCGPTGYGRMGREPSLYAELVADPCRLRAVADTLPYVGPGVNLKLFLALLLSGLFMRNSPLDYRRC